MRVALDCMNTEATVASARASYATLALRPTLALQGSWLTAVPSAASKFVRPNHTAMIRSGGPGGSS